MLSLKLADTAGLRWAQEQVTRQHYLHAPVDVRCRPLAYLVVLTGVGVDDPLGCLLFGRPEATRVNGWYGSVEDVWEQRCEITRWQVLNLARVWLDPVLQYGGAYCQPDLVPGFTDRRGVWRSTAASHVITLALERVVFDYLLSHPPVWMEQPYELVHVISYCDVKRHRGTVYQATGFELVRENGRGIQTYRKRVRPLTREEHATIARRSLEDQRAQRLRRLAHTRHIKQLTFDSLGNGEDTRGTTIGER